jgi:hypothetical protein
MLRHLLHSRIGLLGRWLGCYKQRMEIYLFLSLSESRVVAFTSDETGDNLPEIYGPWKRCSTGRAVPLGSRDSAIVEEIRKNGYFLTIGGSEPLAPARVH